MGLHKSQRRPCWDKKRCDSQCSISQTWLCEDHCSNRIWQSPQIQGSVYEAYLATLCRVAGACSPGCTAAHSPAPPGPDPAPSSPPRCAGDPAAALHSGSPHDDDTPREMTWGTQHPDCKPWCQGSHADSQTAVGDKWPTCRSWCTPPASLLCLLILPAVSGCSWCQPTGDCCSKEYINLCNYKYF